MNRETAATTDAGAQRVPAGLRAIARRRYPDLTERQAVERVMSESAAAIARNPEHQARKRRQVERQRQLAVEAQRRAEDRRMDLLVEQQREAARGLRRTVAAPPLSSIATPRLDAARAKQRRLNMLNTIDRSRRGLT